MSILEAILLGIIQGLTEFLPISSSGHLQLGQYFLGMSHLQDYITFNLVCHMGTLMAVLWIFSEQIKTIFASPRIRLNQVLLGTLPLFPLLLILKPIKALFDQPQYIGYCFLFTAFLLHMGMRLGNSASQETLNKYRWRDALIIGVSQAVAILPGISRSGSTISTGRILGWQHEDALAFSFLLAIPAILGGMTLEMFQLFSHSYEVMPTVTAIGWVQYLAGFVTSLVVGFLSLGILKKLAAKDNFGYFVYYCLFIGIATLFYFNFPMR